MTVDEYLAGVPEPKRSRLGELRATIRDIVPDAEETISYGRIPTLLAMVWDGFSGPLFRASCEIWVAARTDRELVQSLRPMEHRLNQQLSRFWHEYFDETGIPSSRLHVALQLTAAMLRGFALEEFIRADERRRRVLFKEWVRVLECVLTDTHSSETTLWRLASGGA